MKIRDSQNWHWHYKLIFLDSAYRDLENSSWYIYIYMYMMYNTLYKYKYKDNICMLYIDIYPNWHIGGMPPPPPPHITSCRVTLGRAPPSRHILRRTFVNNYKYINETQARRFDPRWRCRGADTFGPIDVWSDKNRLQLPHNFQTGRTLYPL